MPNQSRRAAPRTEAITVLVPRAKKKTFLELLKLLHLGEVQTLEQLMKRFIETAPVDVPLTDEDIDAEVKAYRAEKAAARSAVAPAH